MNKSLGAIGTDWKRLVTVVQARFFFFFFGAKTLSDATEFKETEILVIA